MSKKTTFGKTPNLPRTMTADAIQRAARADRDAQPLTETDFKRMKRTPRAKIIRRALGLSQEEFAARYRIPLGTLRDWEQSRSEPDQTARAYLEVIAAEPKVTAHALDRSAAAVPAGRVVRAKSACSRSARPARIPS